MSVSNRSEPKLGIANPASVYRDQAQFQNVRTNHFLPGDITTLGTRASNTTVAEYGTPTFHSTTITIGSGFTVDILADTYNGEEVVPAGGGRLLYTFPSTGSAIVVRRVEALWTPVSATITNAVDATDARTVIWGLGNIVAANNDSLINSRPSGSVTGTSSGWWARDSGGITASEGTWLTQQYDRVNSQEILNGASNRSLFLNLGSNFVDEVHIEIAEGSKFVVEWSVFDS